MYFKTFSVVMPVPTDVNTEQVTEGIHGLVVLARSACQCQRQVTYCKQHVTGSKQNLVNASF